MEGNQLEAVLNLEGLTEECSHTAEKWASVLLQKLLETTHGTWIYRMLATSQKEKLQEEIEHQLELGGWAVRGRYMDDES
jgi:hypothetical protein